MLREAEMWDRFRAFLAGSETLHNSRELALVALPEN